MGPGSAGGSVDAILDARCERGASGAAQLPGTAHSALAELLGDIAAHRAKRGRDDYPELPLLEYFRETWARVGTDAQLRQSLDQVPKNAGPLNSSSLVHRSLLLMQELSPEYLRQFLSYVDTLSWIERMSADVVPAASDAPRAKTVRKRTRAAAR